MMVVMNPHECWTPHMVTTGAWLWFPLGCHQLPPWCTAKGNILFPGNNMKHVLEKCFQKEELFPAEDVVC